jgi:flagellar basal body-associated protein FliL
MAERLNKKGDITVTILVLLVIAIFGLAIYTFINTSSHVRNYFVDIGLLEKLNSQIEQRIFNNQAVSGLYVEDKQSQGFLFWKKEIVSFSAEYKGLSS